MVMVFLNNSKHLVKVGERLLNMKKKINANLKQNTEVFIFPVMTQYHSLTVHKCFSGQNFVIQYFCKIM